MNDLIEKVKQGLKCHHTTTCMEKYGEDCPYWAEKSCTKDLMADSLSVIEQMEHEIERLREIATRDCDICANKMLKDERRWLPKLPKEGEQE